MKNRWLLSVSAAVLAVGLAGPAQAADATSFKYLADIITEDENMYAEYEVNCSNLYKNEMRAWDNEERWCVGKGSENACYANKIEAAKRACKILAAS